MLTRAIAGPFDLDDDGMVEQAVEYRGGYDRIAEELPRRQSRVRCQWNRIGGAFVVMSRHAPVVPILPVPLLPARTWSAVIERSAWPVVAR